MAIPQLKQSCCGSSLYDGSKIIGWLCLVCSVLGATACIYQVTRGRVLSIEIDEGNYVDLENVYFVPAIIGIITGILSLSFSILLLNGVYTENATKVFIWVIYALFGLVCYLLGNLYTSIALIVNGALTVGAVYFFFGLLGITFEGYLVLVVYSFYRELRTSNSNVVNYQQAPQHEGPYQPTSVRTRP